MKSLLGTILNLAPEKTPVPLVTRRSDSAASLGLARKTSSGPTEAALAEYGKSGTLFAIVGGLAEDSAGVDWRLWRKSRTGRKEDREEVTEHAALTVWNTPNAFMTGQEYREVQQQYMDLVGEIWHLMIPGTSFSGPLGMFPVMPHKMAPVPSPTKYLAGYTYTDPDGRKVPLRLDEVRFMRRPNPQDYWRGLGPVQAMMLDLGLAQYSRAWNLNFFRNGAEPGGVVEMPETSDDDDFDEMVQRWREQHQGVANAHRVAVLEAGAKWVERKITQRDMQYVDTLRISNEQIMVAYRYPKGMLGIVEDVNRANAEAGRAVYAQNLLVPRLERWKAFANIDFLPMFGETARDLEFDYENPVEEDSEKANAERDSKVAAVRAYVEMGADPAETCEIFDLPIVAFAERPAPALPTAPESLFPVPASAALVQAVAAGYIGHAHQPAIEARARESRPRRRSGARVAAGDDEDAARADQLEQVQEDWEEALAALMAVFDEIAVDWRTDLGEQIEDAVEREDTEALARLVVENAALEEAVIDAMSDLTDVAAERMADEAADQDVLVDPVGGPMKVLAPIAVAASALIATGYVVSAGREALRLTHPGAAGADVARSVVRFLEGLANVAVSDLLGGALTGAQNAGRIATLRAAPVAAYYADETLDRNTCGPCRDVDGKWLGNDLDLVEDVYPNGGYTECLGRERCRGTVVAIWRPETVDDDGS